MHDDSKQRQGEGRLTLLAGKRGAAACLARHSGSHVYPSSPGKRPNTVHQPDRIFAEIGVGRAKSIRSLPAATVAKSGLANRRYHASLLKCAHYLLKPDNP